MAQKGKKAVLASAHNEISQIHRQPLIRKSNRRSRPWIAMGGRSGLLTRTGKGPFAGKAYLFKGSRYVRYDWATDKTDPGYPRSIAAMWPGLPAGFTSDIQAAMNGQKGFEGKLYLFKGADYARYDWVADHGDPGYPRPVAFNWL